MDRIFAFLQLAEFWHWFAFSAVLVIIEILAPSVLFLWLGIAASLTGFVLLLNPDLTWHMQWVLFAALSVFSVFGGRAYIRSRPIQTDLPMLNKRGEQYVGRSFTLTEPIVNGIGKLHVDDTSWKVEGDDMPAGTTVQVTGVHGVVLRVALKA